MENRNNNTLIKFIVVLGSLAAIFLAAALIYKKYNGKRLVKNSDPFEFDDDFFFDDCEGCYDDSFDPEEIMNAASEDAAEDEDLAF